jgi:hypothetical protein
MTRRTIHFSDLSSRPILDDADVVRVVVIDHPALSGNAVEFEAAASEVADLDQGALDVAVIELHPDGEPPRRVILDAAAFDKLAVDQPMAELLSKATPVRPTGRADRAVASGAASRPNYATLEHAGAPHKGKVTEAEAQLVRDNLDAVNARLAAADQRTIDPADPVMRERYGFGPAEDAVAKDAVAKDEAAKDEAAKDEAAKDEAAKDEADGMEKSEEPQEAATPPGAEATSSTRNAEPAVTPSTQRSSAAKSAAGHRRSSAGSTSTPGAASR